jgi:putative SOS response-associated peptidase YedK
LCGRYTLSTVDGPEIAQRFGLIAPPDEETLGRFNVCPTETIATVLQPTQAASVAWGLRPFRNQKFTPINVRSETAAQRFKWLMTTVSPGGLTTASLGRCLVLADGWYEWMKQERKGAPRLPFRYTVDGGAPFAFAGLYDGTGAAILTTTANEICAPVHDRMPVVLEGPEAEAAWLSSDVGVEEALEFLVPLENARVSVAPANPAVNKAGVEGAELLTPPSNTLF